MFKAATKLLRYSSRLRNLPTFYTIGNWKTLPKTSTRFFGLLESEDFNRRVNMNIEKCESLKDLFGFFDKYKRYLGMEHVSMVLKKFYLFTKDQPSNPTVENYYNQVMDLTVTLCERPNEKLEPKTVAVVYHFISLMPYSNNFTKRCNFLLEQKGLLSFDQVGVLEVSGLFNSFARNQKKSYAQALLPQIISTIPKYPVNRVVSLLNSASRLDIKSLELAKKVRDYFVNLEIKDEDKLKPIEFSYVLLFFAKYPEVTDSEELARQLEKLCGSVGKGKSLGLSLQSLAAFDRPFSKRFYRLTERRVLESLPDFDNELLVAAVVCYFKVAMENENMSKEMMAEIIKRVYTIDKKHLAIIMYYYAKNKKLNPTTMETFTNQLVEKGIEDLESCNFEHLLFTYNYYKSQGLEIPEKMGKLFAKYITEKQNAFTLQQLTFILECFSIFSEEDQKKVSEVLQKALLNKEADIRNNQNSLQELCRIGISSINQLSDTISPEFLNKLVDLSNEFAIQDLRDDLTQVGPVLIEIYGKFLYLLSQKGLSSQYCEKREKLFNLTEQYITNTFKSRQTLPESLLQESNLFNYIKAFYSVFGVPSQEMERVFRETIKQIDINSLSRINLKFLEQRTEILAESISNPIQARKLIAIL